MRLPFLRRPFVRRICVPAVAVFVLLAATAEAAHACFFGCIYHFGLITVEDGTVWYYNGCEEYSEGGHTYVICYYTDTLN